jgi:hypothetical protein
MAANTLFRKACIGLLCCVLSCSAWAGRPVKVYEVDLKGGQTPGALQDAMREALVRATGRRESASDPALASVIADAQTYVKGYTPLSKGQSQVIFDSTAVDRAIAAAGRGVWDRNRPFTLIVLTPAPPRGTEDAARVELEQTAIARGLPVSLVPLSPVDTSGNVLGRDALMELAQKYGGDAVLVGKGDTSSSSAQLQWTLSTRASSQSWTGTLAGGVNGAVDTMAPAQAGSLADIESGARVEIVGVGNLTDYVNVQRTLESVPGVRRANVAAARGNTVVFDVLARGGSDAVSRTLAGSNHLARSDASSVGLAYQYRP